MTRRRPGLALFAALVLLAPTIASSETISIDYSVSIRGFPVGSARLTAEIAERGYSIAFSGGIRGIARLFSDAATSGTVSGRVGPDRLQPSEYAHLWSEDGETESVSMRFSGRGVAEIDAPPRSNPQRYVPLTPDTKADALDPVSAFVWPGEFGNGLCDRTFPLIDGRRRFDIALAFKRTETFTAQDQSGPMTVVVCSFRYRPVAGHRTGRKHGGSILDSDDAEVWVAPLAEGLASPVRIQFRTRAGRIVMLATAFGVD